MKRETWNEFRTKALTALDDAQSLLLTCGTDTIIRRRLKNDCAKLDDLIDRIAGILMREDWPPDEKAV